MNNLSLLLYGASVSENVAVILLIGAVVTVIGIGIVKLAAAATDEPQPKTRNLALAAGAAALIAAFLPSKQTVYMIAASETAERVAATPEAREMMDLLRRKIIATLSDKT
jgi:flagellar basal body-associated protein FliL